MYHDELSKEGKRKMGAFMKHPVSRTVCVVNVIAKAQTEEELMQKIEDLKVKYDANG